MAPTLTRSVPAGTVPASLRAPIPILGGVQFYTNGIGVGGVNGIPKGLVNNSWNNWGPRLGFAYDLTGQAKTVIRGGFGMTYERIQGNDMYNGAVNPPGDPNPTLNGVSLQNPGLSRCTEPTPVQQSPPLPCPYFLSESPESRIITSLR